LPGANATIFPANPSWYKLRAVQLQAVGCERWSTMLPAGVFINGYFYPDIDRDHGTLYNYLYNTWRM